MLNIIANTNLLVYRTINVRERGRGGEGGGGGIRKKRAFSVMMAR